MSADNQLSNLPAPLVLAEVDLRDFVFMPVEIGRLFNSEFHARANDSEWRAGMTLWLKSYHQVPAASIPDDDVALARLAEMGRDIKAWRKVRPVALYGWVHCSDGRWYHPVVAEKALQAWERKQDQRVRTLKARIAATEKRFKDAVTDSDKEHLQSLLQGLRQSLSQTLKKSVTDSATDPVTSTKGQGQGQGQGLLEPSESKDSGADAPPGNDNQDPASVIFSQGVRMLTSAGVADRHARSVLGRAREAMGDESTAALVAKMAMMSPPLSDPVAYLMKAAKGAGVPAERL